MMDGLTVTAATKYPKVDGATEQKGEPMADLIDRKAAMESLTREYNRKGRSGGLQLAWIEKAINEVPSAEPRWIPCSERLPKEDGYYLVTNSKWGAPWREITLWMTDGWSSDNKPIAWMPLPEPWKGEEDGGSD